MTGYWDVFPTPTRMALLQGVADLEVSLDEAGTYTWLGGRKVNAALAELEAAGWIVFSTDTAAPHITGSGRIVLRQYKVKKTT